MWANFKPFFADEHQTWQKTQTSLASGIYTSFNALDQKVDETGGSISFISAATESNRETYSKLETTIASLKSKITSANKNLV